MGKMEDGGGREKRNVNDEAIRNPHRGQCL